MTETSDKTGSAAIDWPLHRRLAMVAIGYIPILHVLFAIVLTGLVLHAYGAIYGMSCAVAMVYLFPPLAARITGWVFPISSGRQVISSPTFLHWWLSAQWQVLFNRLPMLEELLRLVPGLYSLWLRLWGAQVGSLVYWTAGLVILDRPFVKIGKQVVFGAGVRINPHVIVPGKGREAELWIAPITIGDDALVGGYCLLSPGVNVSAGTSVPAGRFVRPFSTWQDDSPAQIISDTQSN